jgi:hypothetical protein
MEGKPILFAYLYAGGGETEVENATMMNREEGGTTLIVAPPKAGWYALRLYGWATERREYPEIAEIPIEVRQLGTPINLPKTYKSFDTYSIGLVNGFQGKVRTGEEIEVAINAPGASKVSFIKEKDDKEPWQDFRKVGGDLWEFRGKLPAGDWTVCRDNPEKERYMTWLIRYVVTAGGYCLFPGPGKRLARVDRFIQGEDLSFVPAA